MKELSPLELKAKIDAGESLQLVDVREPEERTIASIGGELIPMGEIISRADEIARDRDVVIYCRSGGRSGAVVRELEKLFKLTNLYNLKGGILAWSDTVDPTITKY